MKQPIFSILGVLTGVLLLPAWAGAATNSPAVIPQPASLAFESGAFTLTADTPIRAGEGTRDAADWLAARLRHSTGFTLPIEAAGASTGGIRLELNSSHPELGPEGYMLHVTPAGVVIGAGSGAGVFYGVQTLLQLLPPEVYGGSKVADVRWEVPSVSITDSPRFAWRGLLVDVARHFIPADDLKTFIDGMAVHKFNTLHLHLTDDQGWRIEIKKYPRLTEVGSIRKESPLPGKRNQGDGMPYGPFFYTQDEIRDLVAYAQARHITIVPEIDMPGHLLSLLTPYPELSCTGGPFEVRTRWGVEPDVLCLGNSNSIPFMKDILGEVLDLFPSRFVHIGGDEVPRVRWQHCPKCQAVMKREGFTREAQLQTWFNEQIQTYLNEQGRRLIGWDEILEGGLTPGSAVMSWRGTEGGIKAAAAGHDVVMSPNSYLYLDYGQTKGPDRMEYIGGFVSLEKVYGYEPVPAQLPAEQQRHILGAQGNLWGEYIWNLSDLEYKAYPRAAALAEVVWSPVQRRSFEDFARRWSVHQRRLQAMGINFYSNNAATDAANHP